MSNWSSVIEIDRLVSERVMGCRHSANWSPTEDLAAAWEMVDRWTDPQGDLGHANGKNRVLVESSGCGCGSAHFMVEIDVLEGEWTIANTPVPLAICLAALRAVGVDEATIEKAIAAKPN